MEKSEDVKIAVSRLMGWKPGTVQYLEFWRDLQTLLEHYRERHPDDL